MKSMTSNITEEECSNCIDKLLDGVPEQQSYRINEVWDLTVPASWERTPEDAIVMEDIRLHLVRGGHGSYWVEGDSIPMLKGLLMLFYSPLLYGHAANREDPPSIISCHFDLISRNTELTQKKQIKPFFWSCLLDIEEYEKILPYFENISHLSKQPESLRYKNELCSSGLHQLLGIVRNLSHSLQQGVFDRRVDAVRSFFEKNPFDNRPLSSFAKDYGLGQDYFSGLFHKQVGMSLRSYRLKCRMDYARYLISLNWDIKSVAAELGYSDQFVFSRLFKKVYGFPPSRFKESAKTVTK